MRMGSLVTVCESATVRVFAAAASLVSFSRTCPRLPQDVPSGWLITDWRAHVCLHGGMCTWIGLEEASSVVYFLHVLLLPQDVSVHQRPINKKLAVCLFWGFFSGESLHFRKAHFKSFFSFP